MTTVGKGHHLSKYGLQLDLDGQPASWVLRQLVEKSRKISADYWTNIIVKFTPLGETVVMGAQRNSGPIWSG